MEPTSALIKALFPLAILCSMASLKAQTLSPASFGSLNSFGITAEYSNDSSHIILGSSRNAKLSAIGLQYQRRLIANHHLLWSYTTEFRPVIVESDPTILYDTAQTLPVPMMFIGQPQLTTRCSAATRAYTYQAPGPPVTTYSGTVSTRCGREQTYAQGLSPLGFRVNLRPGSRWQPTFSTLEGYIFSTQPLPVANAGSFNFSFEFGAGVEYYKSARRSIRIEYQVQHYSNHGTASANPGVDNGLFKATYSFGR